MLRVLLTLLLMMTVSARAQTTPLGTINAAMRALYDRDWNEVIRLTNTVIGVEPRAELIAYQMRAKALVRTYRYDAAISDTNRILSLAPNSGPVPYRLRGQAYSGKRQYDEAIADLTRAIAAMNLPATAFCWHYDRALAYRRKGDAARAAADIAEAERLEPDQAKNLYCLGVAKLKIGDVSGQADVTQAVALNPDVIEDMQRYGEAGF